MTAEEAPRTSVLAQLTADVMAEKKTAARTLTPVAGEVVPPKLPSTPASFPNDIPQEVIEQKVGELTRIIAHLTEARDALAAVVEAPVPDKVIDIAEVQKAKERAADEKAAAPNFNADFKAKQAAAQAAVYVGSETLDEHGQETYETPEWTCPEHGKATEKTSNKTGRTFIGCPDCNLFKR